MKSTKSILLLILAITTNYLNGSQPQENRADDRGILQALAQLRQKRHEKKLIELGLKKRIEQVAPQENNPEKQNPACGCSGCFSRMCKLGWSFFCCIIPRQN